MSVYAEFDSVYPEPEPSCPEMFLCLSRDPRAVKRLHTQRLHTQRLHTQRLVRNAYRDAPMSSEQGCCALRD